MEVEPSFYIALKYEKLKQVGRKRRYASMLPSASTEREQLLQNDHEWRFNDCPPAEVPTCFRYEYARECPRMVNVVEQAKAFFNDESSSPILIHADKICKAWPPTKNGVNFLQTIERCRATYERWFGLLNGFPKSPWLDLSQEARREYLALSNADEIAVSAGLEFYYPDSSASWSDWQKKRPKAISGWFSITPSVLNKAGYLKNFEMLLDTLSAGTTVAKNRRGKFFRSDNGGRSGPADALRQLGGYRLSTIDYSKAEAIMQFATGPFAPGDISNLGWLAKHFASAKTSRTKWLLGKLSEETIAILKQPQCEVVPEGEFEANPLELALCRDLNAILEGERFYNLPEFENETTGVQIKPDGSSLPPSSVLRLHHRRLIENALWGGLKRRSTHKPYGSAHAIQYAAKKASELLLLMEKEAIKFEASLERLHRLKLPRLAKTKKV
jgi:hypothetical protein